MNRFMKIEIENKKSSVYTKYWVMDNPDVWVWISDLQKESDLFVRITEINEDEYQKNQNRKEFWSKQSHWSKQKGSVEVITADSSAEWDDPDQEFDTEMIKIIVDVEDFKPTYGNRYVSTKNERHEFELSKKENRLADVKEWLFKRGLTEEMGYSICHVHNGFVAGGTANELVSFEEC